MLDRRTTANHCSDGAANTGSAQLPGIRLNHQVRPAPSHACPVMCRVLNLASLLCALCRAGNAIEWHVSDGLIDCHEQALSACCVSSGGCDCSVWASSIPIGERCRPAFGLDRGAASHCANKYSERFVLVAAGRPSASCMGRKLGLLKTVHKSPWPSQGLLVAPLFTAG